jgi:hypothetical protein
MLGGGFGLVFVCIASGFYRTRDDFQESGKKKAFFEWARFLVRYGREGAKLERGKIEIGMNVNANMF